ncbi:MAG: histidinol dehydrogenase [Clostridiales Family XIII bacterium]|jgi:histidinol dehydrogenase|nr:histidinol dehydrogenase [Clostridiales Family XIII bacterium]
MMRIQLVHADGAAEYAALKRMEARTDARDRETEEAVLSILREVRANGDAALRAYGLRFDGGCPESAELGREAFAAALAAAPPAFRGALERAAANIRRYHEGQVCAGYEIRERGVTLGQTVRGLARVGLYVPGGTAAYPSTVLMNGIPAKLAGVSELIMVTPPVRVRAGTETRYTANPDILAAACIAGVDRLFLTGGAQAVAALAYGTESIPRVDKIVGPGNIFVATAKRLLYGKVDIDMIAGPSEILVLADAGASPAYIAADMLSQAEHDADAAAVLLTTSAELAAAVADELERRLRDLPRGRIARASLESFGLIVVCRSTDEMLALADRIAPEHLEILLEDPLSYLGRIRNAGSVFCGPYAPEPLGDYYAGTNHVLPTAGAARFASPLGVYDFVKRMSYTHYTREALAAARDDIITIAEREGLDAHADAIRARFSHSHAEAGAEATEKVGIGRRTHGDGSFV